MFMKLLSSNEVQFLFISENLTGFDNLLGLTIKLIKVL